MHNVMPLANTALKLFLQSLSYGCIFNVCSYGSDHEFMFNDGSVEYNEENLRTALEQIESFEADFGGTEIFDPLEQIFEYIEARNKKPVKSHIYLLTDGAVNNN